MWRRLFSRLFGIYRLDGLKERRDVCHVSSIATPRGIYSNHTFYLYKGIEGTNNSCPVIDSQESKRRSTNLQFDFLSETVLFKLRFHRVIISPSDQVEVADLRAAHAELGRCWITARKVSRILRFHTAYFVS